MSNRQNKMSQETPAITIPPQGEPPAPVLNGLARTGRNPVFIPNINNEGNNNSGGRRRTRKHSRKHSRKHRKQRKHSRKQRR